jgi:hypothetical protein
MRFELTEGAGGRDYSGHPPTVQMSYSLHSQMANAVSPAAHP